MSDDKNLRDELNDILGHAKNEVKKAAERVSEKAEEFAEEAKEKASTFAEDAKEKASTFAEEAKEMASTFVEDAKETAKEFTTEAKGSYSKASGDNKKVIVGILAIFLGGFGVHKFILGYNKEGFILLVLTIVLSVFNFGFFGWLVWIFTVLEGIIYLSKSDKEFYNTYQVGKKPWF